jgi:2'-5' RNA ligase
VVFVLVAEGIPACEAIESRVRSGILERELTFNYHPHVTVAHHLDDDSLNRAFDTLADYEATFRVSSFELFEHGDDGVWRPVLSLALDGVSEEVEA